MTKSDFARSLLGMLLLLVSRPGVAAEYPARVTAPSL